MVYGICGEGIVMLIEINFQQCLRDKINNLKWDSSLNATEVRIP